jgi:hypothetical protein
MTTIINAATSGGLIQTADTSGILQLQTASTAALTVDASQNVGIGTSSPSTKLHVEQSTTGDAFKVARGGNYIIMGGSGSGTQYIKGYEGVVAFGNEFAGATTFLTSNTERMRIDSSGNLLVGSTSADLSDNNFISKQSLNTTAGIAVINNNTGSSATTAMRYKNSGSTFAFTGLGSTGRSAYAGLGANILSMYTDNAAGMSFLVDAAGPITFNTNSTERMRISSDGNVLVAKTSADDSVQGFGYYNNRINVTSNGAPNALFNRNTDDGDLVLFRQDNVTEGTISVSGTTVSYNGGHLARWSQLLDNSKDDTILKGTVLTNLDNMCVWTKDGEVLPNEQLNKMKVSDVEGDTNVAGVFVNWTRDEDCNSDDMNIAMTGDMIIRIAGGVVVQKGDLLMSSGNGTAKPQGDDIVRSKTIAKVTSNYITCTYADGSYCVPCVLMAC